jgi:hypothetical protein
MRIGVSFALLQGQSLAGEISRSAFLERASPLAVVGDKVLAISANHAARQKDLKSSFDHIAVRSGAEGSVVARRLTRPTVHPIGFATGTCTGTCYRWSVARTTPSHGSPRTFLPPTRTEYSEF